MLTQFDFSPERGRYLFVEELLQLYLYNDCYFEFDRLIDLYLRHDCLLISTAKSLLRPLYCLGHYDCELKLINYVIASTVS